MKKLLSLLLILASSVLSAQQWGVFLEAFTVSAESDYFAKLPYKVDEQMDGSGKFFRYYIVNLKSETEATAARDKALSLGYRDARVVDFIAMRENCASNCRRKNKDDPGFISDQGPCAIRCSTGDDRSSFAYIEPQYFSENSASLSDETAVSSLFEELREKRGYSVALKGFADTKNGESSALAVERAKAVKDYLVSLGISEHKVSVSNGGSAGLSNFHPLRPESLKDARQEYRRVEMYIKDAKGNIKNFRYNH